MARPIVSSIIVLLVAFLIGYDVFMMDAISDESESYRPYLVGEGFHVLVEYEGELMKVSIGKEQEETLILDQSTSPYEQIWKQTVHTKGKFLKSGGNGDVQGESVVMMETNRQEEQKFRSKQDLMDWLEQQNGLLVLDTEQTKSKNPQPHKRFMSPYGG
ncbi:hypothetical protein [Alkalihalobacillus pseudalcaliphilus]|uniref:hypothetical protein n=1 Tax=Alkalihalobacillus pseudalcaliphilus TaxID=79884 RepID=UPI000A440438|nr:hypothetical protein [Alkalihalobacillus pseudalcaliphilus]